jgi:Leucine-rich repeat (LRR) protein
MLIPLLSIDAFGQKNKLYTSLEEALAAPADSVYRLDLSKQKLDSLPQEVMTFKNLRELHLEKNRLTSLPDNFYFEDLRILDISKNKLENFPEALCKVPSLRRLYISKNKIDSLPDCIGNMSDLIELDAWFNPIDYLPESLTQLRNLRSLDLRGMNFTNEFQQKWQEKLPWVKIEFDLGCDCGG